MDIPSLFMIPSAVSSGKVHSVFPNSTDADFDFNRDSTATRVNSQGLIEEVGFFGSELVSGDNANFSSSTGNWQQFRGVLSWDSYLQAGKWTDNNTSGGPVGFTMSGGVIPTLASKTYIIEFKAKTDSNNSFNFSFIGESSTFNAISNPNLTSDFQNYKFTFVTSTANQRLYVGFSGSPLDNGESYFIDNVSIKEITGDRARLNYEIEGGLVNTKPSLLLEPQSTNLFTKSNDVDATAATKLDNQITSPEGLQNAALYVENTATASHGAIKSAILPTAGATTYTLSVFAKAKERHLLRLNIYADGASNLTDNFDLINGTVSDANSTIEDFGNGWFRCSTTKTVTNSGGYNFAAVYMGKATNNYYYAGDGQSGLYLFGFQLEQQSYPTSYIPTNGSTQTRAAETCNGAGTSSILPSEEGILYIETSVIGLTSTLESISISDGTYNNAILFRYYDTSDNQIQYVVRVGSSIVAAINFTLSDALAFNKIALRYKANDFALWANGTQVGTDTSGAIPTGLSTLQLDRGDGSGDFYGKIRDIRVYNTKEMTDSEVDILLTKITS